MLYVQRSCFIGNSVLNFPCLDITITHKTEIEKFQFPLLKKKKVCVSCTWLFFCLISLFGCCKVMAVLNTATFRMFIYRTENCHNVTVCSACRVIKHSVNNNKITLCSDRVSFIADCLFHFKDHTKLKSCTKVSLQLCFSAHFVRENKLVIDCHDDQPGFLSPVGKFLCNLPD